VPGAAAAALVIVALVVLWPLSPGRGRAERGLILTFAPATAGFVVVVGAARAAFARAVEGASAGPFGGASSIEWTVASALLPVTLAAGVVVGVRVARQSEPAGFEPAAVVGTWVVFAAAIVLGLSARAVLGVSAEVLGPPERVVGLSVAALAAGLAAARVARRKRTPLPAEPRGDAFRMELPPVWPRAARVASASAPALVALALGATMWLTYEGLREGFLG
jgi:small-conductance mechanosensitive channel